MKLEVAKKQAYIFASQRLVENARASARIAYVTSSSYFQKIAPSLYTEKENLVYAGGGHTVLQFDSKEQATAFARTVTSHTMKTYEGLELFCAQLPYEEGLDPKENLQALSLALEKKKSLRQAGFRLSGIGLEDLSENNYRPYPLQGKIREEEDLEPLGREFHFAREFTELTMKPEETPSVKEHFLAVVHIDGNAMSKRIQEVYFQKDPEGKEDQPIPLADLPQALQQFSNGIQENFEEAFRIMVRQFLKAFPQYERKMLPIRPVILAGDDVCFVCAGSIALDLSRFFMEALAQQKNPQDGKAYASCAGIALVHMKYPFFKACELAESLCSSAKKRGIQLEPEGTLSLMDWHIQYGELKESLGEIREDYICEDGNVLTLRPLVVETKLTEGKIPYSPYFSYDYFKNMVLALQGKIDSRFFSSVARGKIKNLRTALKQGELETEYYLEVSSMNEILYYALYAKSPETAIEEAVAQMKSEGKLHKISFAQIEPEKKHCIYYDSIEMTDLFFPLAERKEETKEAMA